MNQIQLIYDTPPGKMPVVTCIGLALGERELDRIKKEIDAKYQRFSIEKRGVYEFRQRIGSLGPHALFSFVSVPNSENSRDPKIVFSFDSSEGTAEKMLPESDRLVSQPQDNFDDHWPDYLDRISSSLKDDLEIGQISNGRTHLAGLLKSVEDQYRQKQLDCGVETYAIIGKIVVEMSKYQDNPKVLAVYWLALQALVGGQPKTAKVADFLSDVIYTSRTLAKDNRRGLLARFTSRHL